jgi:hypothetical protein
MTLMRLAIVAASFAAVLGGASASAQTFPVTPGTLEFQLGLAMITLPEDHDGTFSAQAEGRAGFFFAEGLQAQLEGHGRFYPLGSQAPGAYGLTAGVLWFPTLGDFRNLYLLGAGGFQYLTYPDRYGVSNGARPIARIGGGLKAPLENAGIPWLRGGHFTAEYRAEWIKLTEEEVDPAIGNTLDFMSGIAVGYSFFR